MKTNAEIKNLVFEFIKDSTLANAVSGIVSKVGRPTDSNREDIVISVLDSGSGQMQTFILNVNVYVADIRNGSNVFENSQRIEQLSRLAVELFESYVGDSFRLTLQKQSVFDVQGKSEHCINNRILITFYNE